MPPLSVGKENISGNGVLLTKSHCLTAVNTVFPAFSFACEHGFCQIAKDSSHLEVDQIKVEDVIVLGVFFCGGHYCRFSDECEWSQIDKSRRDNRHQ